MNDGYVHFSSQTTLKNQNQWVSGLCPSSSTLKTYSQCLLDWVCFHPQVREGRMETDPTFEMLFSSFLEYKRLNNVQTPIASQSYTSSSQRFSINSEQDYPS
jgi:hypothetical protein